MKFGDQEWRRDEESDKRQVKVLKKEENSKSTSKGGREGIDVEKVEDEIETVRPQRKKEGGHGSGARPKLRRPVLPVGGEANLKGIKSEVVVDQLDPAANLADSFNQGLKVNTEPVGCAKSTLTDPGKVKSTVTAPSKTKAEEQWEPLWIRQMRENGAGLSLTGTPYPKNSVEEPVGRAIWSPPKGSGPGMRGRGRGRSPPGWKPTGDSLLS